METATRERLNDVLDPYDRPGMPGLVATVVRGVQVIYQRCVGLADVEHGVPNGPDSVYHLASASKQFTSFAVAQPALAPDLPDRGSNSKQFSLMWIVLHDGHGATRPVGLYP